MGVED